MIFTAWYVPYACVIPGMLNIWNASTAPEKMNSQRECKKTHGEGKSNSSNCQRQRADPVWSCIHLYGRVSTTSGWRWGTVTAKLKPRLPPNDVLKKNLRCYNISNFNVHRMDKYAHCIVGKLWALFSGGHPSLIQNNLWPAEVTSCKMKCGLETRPACQGFVPAKSLLVCDWHNPHQTKTFLSR